jgi:uncharacterized protein (TIGR01777 family)
MPRLASSVYLPATAAEAYAWFGRPATQARLVPPWDGARLVAAPAGIADGARLAIDLPIGPLHWRWIGAFGSCDPPRRVVLRQLSGPLARWEHRASFTDDEDSCRLAEEITWDPRLGKLGQALAGAATQRRIDRWLAWRGRRATADLGRLRDARASAPLRVAISGAGGLIGSALAHFLESGGDTVLPMVRRRARAGQIAWDPASGSVDGAALDGVDAVVHLAGAPVATRWSASARERIRASRVDGTRALATALAKLPRKPEVLIAASAIGWYGDRGDALLDESAVAGTGFLPEVCTAWEQACAPAAEAGIRVVHLRIGIVLSAVGGALPPLARALKLGMGVEFGDGRQWMSWIAHDDLIYLVHHALRSRSLSGRVNAVAPEPVRHHDLVSTLGRILQRRTRLHLPSAWVRRLLGEMGQEMLLSSARVVSRAIEQETFAYSSPALEDALRWELGLLAPGPKPSPPASHGPFRDE